MKILHKFVILFESLYAFCLKWCYDTRLFRVPCLGERSQRNIIVSLTSYGRRVSNGIVCYSVYSLLRQSVQPEKIIVWLDKDEWSDDTLPKRVAELRLWGVEIRYTENMRSYKKLIPAYQAFPEDYILTADDDILYPKDLIETTWMTHLHYPEAIIGTWMREPHIENGAAEPYSTWDYIQPEEPQPMPMPVGAAGVFYPPHSLKKEMMEWDLARQYAPQADDIWFWAAGMATGTKKITPKKRYEVLSFDSIYQYFHSGSSLQSSNVKGHGEMTNDDQMKATLRFIKENGWIE